MNIEDKLFLDRFVVDDRPHIEIIDQEKCRQCSKKPCTYTCPAQCYKEEEGKVVGSFEGCLECGTCRIICSEAMNLRWNYPRGGFGVTYKFG